MTGWNRTSRKPGAIVSTNTSGIPLARISADYPAEFLHVQPRYAVAAFVPTLRGYEAIAARAVVS